MLPSDLSSIAVRVKAIGLSRKLLAQDAGLPAETIGRALNGSHVPLLSTCNRIDAALASREVRIARHLLTLPHVQAALRQEEAA